MTFVTKMTLQSGDRVALDDVVSEIQSVAARKGAELKGPHSNPPEQIRVSLYTRLSDPNARAYDPWNYTVYTRELEIVGHDEVARQITRGTDFPPSIHVEVEIEQIQPLGRSA